MRDMDRLVAASLGLILVACGSAPHVARSQGSVTRTRSAPGDGQAQVADRRMATILEAHNRVRSAHCAAPLAWSDALAAHAQGWADHLAADGCRLVHSGHAYGENLAAGTAGTLSPEGVVELWSREVASYDHRTGGFSMETGHYTQVVWTSSERLGCGVAQCGGLEIWVCNYDPPGNYEGQFQTHVLPTSCR